MKTPDRATIENWILLRSTGELPPAESAALAELLKHDSEAAAFAGFVADNFPGKAPRDFAAEAIRCAAIPPVGNGGIITPLWRRILIPAAAAAVFALLGLAAWHFRSPPRDLIGPVAHQPGAEPRFTATISSRLASLEAEISTTRDRLSRGRYHRSSAPL